LLQVVDFVIWKLFNNNNGSKPQHLLTHGFQRPSMAQNVQQTSIPGIVSQFPNQNVQVLKDGAWAEVLDLLGSNGEEIMMQLLFDCGVFAAINARKGIYYQLSGMASPSCGKRIDPDISFFSRYTALGP
jgi:telomerase reverse transcriptase